MGGNQLVELPEFIGQLRQLESLDLSNNRIPELPVFISRFDKLKALNLTNTQLTSRPTLISNLKLLQVLHLHLHKELLHDPLDFIGELKDLRVLYLYHAELTTIPEFITNLTRLQVLSLQNTHLKRLPKSVTSLRQLRLLNLSFNEIAELPSFIGELKHLQELRLCKNLLTSLPESIADLKQLQVLDIQDNLFDSTPTVVGKIKQLKALFMRGIPIISLPEFITELKQLRMLGLGRMQLQDLPDSIAKLNLLHSLSLRDNQLASLPRSIGRLTRLQSLDLIENNFKTLPESLTSLEMLEILRLDSNAFTELPAVICNLQQLKELSLGNNKLTTLAGLPGKLKKLEILWLRANKLTILPEPICELKKLKRLYLDSNLLKSLPEPIGKLNLLEALTASHNQIEYLPDSIGKLKRLNELQLYKNKLTTVPETITELTKLYNLNLAENPLERPPRSIAIRGIKAIQNYFEQIKQQGFDYLHEAKLIIVGDPGVGKTTLLNKLLDPSYPVPTKRKATIGINVRPWTFPLNTSNHGDEELFHANLWDFGGHDIQYMTHHFFLTSRSLYILVIDNSGQQSSLDYWFNIIESLGVKSPIIIVQNEFDQNTTKTFNLDYYDKQYPGLIREYRDINLSNIKDGRYTTLVNTLTTNLQQLEHIGEELPKQWIPIRHNLEALRTQKHITFDEYQTICGRNSIIDEQQQLYLSAYLHDLGVILHFQHELDIAYWIILDPQWVVDAVYTILSDDTIQKQNGRLSQEWLFDKWSDTYNLSERAYLLSLMLKHRFDIIYPLDNDEKQYIAPLLLPATAPSFAWNDKDNLAFRYQYRFMPYGLMSRLIVRLSSDIEHSDYALLNWKTGVVLKTQSVRAFIEEGISDEGLKVIDINIAGDDANRKQYLEWIRGEIGKLHKYSFKDILVDQMVPCNRCIESKALRPKYIPYTELKRCIEAHVKETFCAVCGNYYSPWKLVYGVYPDDNGVEAETSPDSYVNTFNETIDDKMEKQSVERDHVVLLIHGIRTQAEWHQRVARTLETDPRIKVAPTRYEFLDIVRFILPIPALRKRPVDRITRLIRDERTRNSTKKLSVIAHSFGTYIIAKILENESDIDFHRIILCGSIIDDKFQWDRYKHRLAPEEDTEWQVINDCGMDDLLPVLAKSVTWGYGSSGRFGFGHVRVKDRFHIAGHSDFFTEMFAEKYWLPYLSEGTVVDGEIDRATTPWWISMLTVIRVRYLFAAIIIAGIILLYGLLRPEEIVTPTETLSTTHLPSKDNKLITIVRRVGTCKYGTFESDLITGVGIYAHQKDSFYFSIQKGVKLSSGTELNSVSLANILEQKANKEQLKAAGYLKSEPSGEHRLRVYVTGEDITHDEKQVFLCTLSKIDIMTLK